MSDVRAALAAICMATPLACAAEARDELDSITAEAGGIAERFVFSDEPGSGFVADSTGTPVAVIAAGGKVKFQVSSCCTDTRHTATLLLAPPGSATQLDQKKARQGTFMADFDLPGVYLIGCKVHPYSTAVVAVLDGDGLIPDVTAETLPFLAHLGLTSVDAATLLSLVTTIAPDDDAKRAKWTLVAPGDPSLTAPPVAALGEIWVSTQFERVPGQSKPGTLTIVDGDSFTVEREVLGGLDPDAAGAWNNPHNSFASFDYRVIYQSQWFGRWINRIDRASGDVEASVEVGHSPTHVITDPNPASANYGALHVPLSAGDDIVRVADRGDAGLEVIGARTTGRGKTHPHGHWLSCGSGEHTIAPNVFKGEGFAGSISIIDTASGDVLEEFEHDPADPLRSALLMPLAAGECHVDLPEGGHLHKAYVGNVVTGMVTVIDVGARRLLRNVPVTLTPGEERSGLGLFDTLQLPIQTPVSPDGRWVATAVFSLTTIPRARTGAADHVAIIDTRTDEVVAFVGTPAGTHGVNWGAKRGGGYYAYVTSQHSNVLTAIDPDPDGDGDAGDAAVVGRALLANGSPGAGATDGTGGQGVLPLPMVHDGWIQPAVDMLGTGALSPEVESWLEPLTPDQRNPE